MPALSAHTRSLQWFRSIVIPWSFSHCFLTPACPADPWCSPLPLEEKSDALLFPRYGAGRCLGMQRSNKSILWQSRALVSLLTELDALGWLEDIPYQAPTCPPDSSMNNCLLRLSESQNKECSSLVALGAVASI